jgi:GWxTD domain-containing protein
LPQKRFTQRSFSVLILLVLIATGTGLLRAATKSSLPSNYAAWLNEEVPYIITNTERSAFLGLKTDADRDAFIQNFWAIRNPDPNSPTNEFRDEYYRRLAYANDQAPRGGTMDGAPTAAWSTSRSDRHSNSLPIAPASI